MKNRKVQLIWAVMLGSLLLATILCFNGCKKKTESTAPAIQKAKIEKEVSEVSGTIEQTTCPVMGNPIDKNVSTDYNGKRVYFCCPMCIDKFKSEPEKYMKKMESEGVKLDDTPKE